jgi:hypothetical protein
VKTHSRANICMLNLVEVLRRASAPSRAGEFWVRIAGEQTKRRRLGKDRRFLTLVEQAMDAPGSSGPYHS